MTSTFYKNAQILKGPKENPSPSKKDIHMVLEHLEDDSLRRYFFDDLDNPAWVSPLHNANFFISHIPSPKEDSRKKSGSAVRLGKDHISKWLASG